MKFIFAFIFSFCIGLQSIDISTIRNQYPTASLSKANADAFVRLLDKTSNNSTMGGYRSAGKIIQAKFAVGEGRKKLITENIKTLESILKSDSDNVELRIIRMSVQEALPKFIKYNGQLEGDKQFILKNYSNQNAALKTYIKKFASQSKTFSAAEKALLK